MKQSAPLEVGICVRDAASMVAFYCDVLGCTEVMRAPIPPAISDPAGMGPDGFEMIWLQTPWGERLKLLGPPEPPPLPAPAEHLTATAGIAYVTFYCEDLPAIIERAMAAGATLLSDPTLQDSDAMKIAFFRDPEGNAVELVQRDNIKSYRPDLN
jgi:catechol 2,3-dioxygenase-like lactoylglutathione lyase family enzyme